MAPFLNKRTALVAVRLWAMIFFHADAASDRAHLSFRNRAGQFAEKNFAQKNRLSIIPFNDVEPICVPPRQCLCNWFLWIFRNVCCCCSKNEPESPVPSPISAASNTTAYVRLTGGDTGA